MFSICFASSETSRSTGHGTIVIGKFSEKFVSAFDHWSRLNYEEQWLDGVSRIRNGCKNAAFITDLQLGAEVLAIWWIAYVQRDMLVFRNSLLLRRLAPHFQCDQYKNIYTSIPEYQKLNADGDRVSEWSMKVAEFLE